MFKREIARSDPEAFQHSANARSVLAHVQTRNRKECPEVFQHSANARSVPAHVQTEDRKECPRSFSTQLKRKECPRTRSNVKSQGVPPRLFNAAQTQ